jgi:uncharacterized protein (TIGR00369 family)
MSSPEPSPPSGLVDDGWCFVCGKENPEGLGLDWSLDDAGKARARFLPARRHQGWQGVLHGGIIAALLDEAMAQCAKRTGRDAVTASLSIRYRKPAPIGATLIAEAWIAGERGRVLQFEALVRGEGNETCYATAQGTCVRLTPARE